MRAPSYPAPPLPLTEQERLLLRIVHKDDPVEMAVLNPVLRAARDAEDQAEFQRFFVKPVIEQPTTGQTAPEQQQQEGQQQIPSGDDNKKSNDKSKSNADDNGKNKGETE
jgi:hypothetical protein